MPFVSAWAGENHLAPVPVAGYGVVLLLTGIAYRVLQQSIIQSQGPHSRLRAAVGRDWKGRISLLCYVAAIGLAFVNSWLAVALYAGVAAMWLAPDPRIERELKREEKGT